MNVPEKHRMRREQLDKNVQTAGRRRGAVVVEGAIVLTSLIVILFGMLDLALLVLESNTLAEAARRLCRQAVVHGQMAAPRMTTWGPGSLTGTAGDGTEVALALAPNWRRSISQR